MKISNEQLKKAKSIVNDFKTINTLISTLDKKHEEILILMNEIESKQEKNRNEESELYKDLSEKNPGLSLDEIKTTLFLKAID